MILDSSKDILIILLLIIMVEAKNYESQYTEGRQLGKGAFGKVYEATHKQE